MCLTWSFATTLSIFIALDRRVQNAILFNLGINSEHLTGFIDFLKNILHLRNMISHNNSIYSASFPYNGPALNKMYEYIFRVKTDEINLYEIMQLIEYFSHSKTLISNTKYYFSKLKIQDKFKTKIGIFKTINP
jgi:abortive infection bacteriophage resistance protein